MKLEINKRESRARATKRDRMSLFSCQTAAIARVLRAAKNAQERRAQESIEKHADFFAALKK
jgi:hypothetical protein